MLRDTDVTVSLHHTQGNVVDDFASFVWKDKLNIDGSSQDQTSEETNRHWDSKLFELGHKLANWDINWRIGTVFTFGTDSL